MNEQILNEIKGLVQASLDTSKDRLAALEKRLPDGDLKEKLAKIDTDLTAANQKAIESEKKAVDAELKAKALEEKLADHMTKANRKTGSVEYQTVGQKFIASEEFKGLGGREVPRGGQVMTEVKDILTDPANANVLVQESRIAGVQRVPNQPLMIRSLLPVVPTTSNAIQFVRETAFTNNAKPQASPLQSSPAQIDGTLKRKSDITYNLVTQAVKTLAHYIKISRQLTNDAPGLMAEIDNRLMYGLGLEEERELLYGTGIQGEITGLATVATPFTAAYNVAGDTKLDKVRHALLQVTVSKYIATGIVMHPRDWHDIELLKTEEGGANKGEYIVGMPNASQAQPMLWGIPVIPSLSVDPGKILTGAFRTATAIHQNETMNIRVFDQNEDDAIRNMVTILAEERLTLAVYRTEALIYGSL